MAEGSALNAARLMHPRLKLGCGRYPRLKLGHRHGLSAAEGIGIGSARVAAPKTTVRHGCAVLIAHYNGFAFSDFVGENAEGPGDVAVTRSGATYRTADGSS